MLGAMSLWSRNIPTFTREFLLVWGLSLASARRHFEKIILITDNRGHDLLAEMPYDMFSLDLETPFIPDSAQHIWAAGKLVAFQRMVAECGQSGACHFDGDVILRKMPHVFGSEIFAQSDESFTLPESGKNLNLNFHETYIGKGAPMIPVLPGHVRFSLTREIQTAYNAGIVGGRNLSFLLQFADEALWVLRHSYNQKALLKISGGSGSCFVEQYLFGSLARHMGVHVATMFGHHVSLNEEYLDQIGYVHLLCDSKRDPFYVKMVEKILEEQFPWMLEIINRKDLPSNPPHQSCPSRMFPVGWPKCPAGYG